MRSSYSTPAAFSAASASVFTRSSWAAEHRARVVEGGLDDAHDVERPRRRRPLEAGDGLEDEGAERVVEGEVGLQVAR